MVHDLSFFLKQPYIIQLNSQKTKLTTKITLDIPYNSTLPDFEFCCVKLAFFAFHHFCNLNDILVACFLVASPTSIIPFVIFCFQSTFFLLLSFPLKIFPYPSYKIKKDSVYDHKIIKFVKIIHRYFLKLTITYGFGGWVG